MDMTKKLEEMEKALEMGRKDFESGPYLAQKKFESTLNDTLGNAVTNIGHALHSVPDKDDTKAYFFVHYTSISALMSMLKPPSQSSFWRLYNSVHSNDPNEGGFLIRILSEKYRWLEEKEEAAIRYAYVASFIFPDQDADSPGKNLNDNLVFWRAYGREGEGCSLLLRQLPSLPNLRKVLYGEEQAKCSMEKLCPVLDVIDRFIATLDTTQEELRRMLINAVKRHTEKIRYLYKSEAYKYEQEYRFVFLESDIDDPVTIRVESPSESGNPVRIRHYLEHEELTINKLLITGSEIVIGPSVRHQHDVCYCIRKLLEEAELGGPIVTVSNIKYRKP